MFSRLGLGWMCIEHALSVVSGAMMTMGQLLIVVVG